MAEPISCKEAAPIIVSQELSMRVSKTKREQLAVHFRICELCKAKQLLIREHFQQVAADYRAEKKDKKK